MFTIQSKLFLRIVSRGKEVYLLKIVTLAIAFACSTLIVLFALNEFGYDKFHTKADNIFRVLQRNTSETYDRNRLSNRIPNEVVKQFRTLQSESTHIARVKVLNEINLTTTYKKLQHQKIQVADPEIADIFSFDIINGNVDSFRSEEMAAIISSSAAENLFGNTQVAGKKLKVSFLEDTVVLVIAAVFKDFPGNSHEKFDVILRSQKSIGASLKFNPDDSGVYGRSDGKSPKDLETILNSNIKEANHVYRLQPLPEVYFGPRVLGEDANHGDRYSIIILICIAGLILFLALTSYINLTTLTLPHRSKELALKKLSGATQPELVFMFARESFSLVAVSLLLGIAVLFLSSEWIESILSINPIALFLSADTVLMIILFCLLIIVGLTPLVMVFKFTRATPTRLMSTETITFPKFKRVITFLQLGISIFLIVASLVIRRQVNYSLLKEPGQNHEQVVYLTYPNITNEGLRNLRAGWKKYHPNIVDVIATSQLPDRINSKELNSEFYFMSVDPVFREFFDLRLIEGTWFKPNDGDSIIVINSAARELLEGNKKLKKNEHLIGVVQDICSQFNLPERPVKINMAPDYHYNYLCVRILEVDIRRTMNYLANTFKTGSQPAVVSYLNKRFEEWIIYQDKLNTLSEVLAIISGLLSCCAIYGLSISLVRDKLKQIAIHKLHGASLFNITVLLAREFVRQMLIALIIFGPFTYIFLKEWLRTFVYTTQFTWTDPFFPLAYCTIIIISLCGFQAMSLNRSDLTSALKG